MKICFDCNTLFERHFDIGLEKVCPVKDCHGDVVEIDDNIFHPIRTLNDKGYTTALCCSGHLWGSDPYIVFDDIVNNDCFRDFPNNFVQDESRSRVVIRRPIKTKEVLERQKELNEAVYNLLEWAENLPIAKKLFACFNIVKPIDDKQFIELVENKLSLIFFNKHLSDTDTSNFFFTTVTPHKVNSLSKKIRTLAKSNGWKVKIEVADLVYPQENTKII